MKAIEERILRLLERHPEGLSIGEIAQRVGIHRTNLSKYLYRLAGAGRIVERKLGKAKLYYPKGVIKRVK
jgi:DNA-binding Lrp family transcriptional regulator